MTVFRVWGPRPRQVALRLGDRLIAMRRGADDWWSVEEAAAAGSDYAFVFDGAEPVPDPRAAWQPHRVHGPSRLVDHGAFCWSDAGWRAGQLDRRITALRSRHHGDFHLGQVRWTGRGFVIFDLEGEPTRPISTRRIKRSPPRDVSGMIRSFHYAVHHALAALRAKGRPEWVRLPLEGIVHLVAFGPAPSA